MILIEWDSISEPSSSSSSHWNCLMDNNTMIIMAIACESLPRTMFRLSFSIQKASTTTHTRTRALAKPTISVYGSKLLLQVPPISPHQNEMKKKNRRTENWSRFGKIKEMKREREKEKLVASPQQQTYSIADVCVRVCPCVRVWCVSLC